MRQILPYQLWIGHAGDGRDVRQLSDLGIGAVIQLALEEPQLVLPREFVYLRFPLLDGTGNAYEIIGLAILNSAGIIQRNIPTLICCGAGMSRSPAIAAAAIALCEEQELLQILKFVTDHSCADISPGFWREVSIAFERLSKDR